MEPTYSAWDAARDICSGKPVDVSYSYLNYWVSRPGRVSASAVGEVPPAVVETCRLAKSSSAGSKPQSVVEDEPCAAADGWPPC